METVHRQKQLRKNFCDSKIYIDTLIRIMSMHVEQYNSATYQAKCTRVLDCFTIRLVTFFSPPVSQDLCKDP